MNRGRVSNRVLLYFLMMMFLMVIGCSSSSSGGGSAATGNATITGTVSGTTIVAIDENNAEAARVEATGTTSQRHLPLLSPLDIFIDSILLKTKIL